LFLQGIVIQGVAGIWKSLQELLIHTATLQQEFPIPRAAAHLDTTQSALRRLLLLHHLGEQKCPNTSNA